MKVNRIICTFFLFSLVSFRLAGQCSFPKNLAINDDSISIYSLSISGAIDNSLMSNGVCAIRIKFRHSTIGEVSISLQSPQGQIVNLIGPTTPISNITDFTTWDITFNQCNGAISPDFGFSPQFNTLQPWGQFGSFVGSYYPYNGCLQDFNLGAVNGTWSIIVSDVSLFDAGIIEDFDIFFCDDTGILCETCDPRPAAILDSDLLVCQGDSILNQALNLSHLEGVSDPLKYSESFIVFNNGQIFDYLANSEFRFYNPGIYQVCHLVYKTSQQPSLPIIGTIANPSSINQTLGLTTLCGRASQECITIEIISPSNSEDIFVEVCQGDSVLVFDTYFKDEGVFPISKGGAICDSIFLINVDVISLKPFINPINPELTCLSDTVSLTANHNELGKAVNFQWVTPDGNIISNPISRIIEVDKVGTYIVEAKYEGCVEYDTVKVVLGSDIPMITLKADTMSCNIDAATITISSSITLVDRIWTGPSIKAQGIFTIKADVPGIYSVIGIDAKGCKGEASIELIGDLEPPSLTFDVANIDCKSDSAFVEVKGIQKGDSISWINPNGFQKGDSTYFTETSGNYYLESFADNGCSTIDTIQVFDQRYSIEVTVTADTIECQKLDVTPSTIIKNASGSVTYEWFSGVNSITTVENPTFTMSGPYILIVKDTNNCEGVANFVIEVDTIAPVLEVKDTIFYCITDSIQIGILNPKPDYSYNWTGPIGFQSFSSNPYIYNDGDYFVEVTDQKGCASIAHIVVIEGPDLPKSSFTVQELDCFHDTAFIVTNDTMGFSFRWAGPGLISTTIDPTAFIISAGDYIVTITQLSDNCRNAYEFTIPDNRSYLDINTTINPLDCKTDVVKPIVLISDVYASFTWEGPVAVDQVIEPDLDAIGDYFLEVTAINGCKSRDTIQVYFDGALPIITTESNIIICNPQTALQVANSPRGEKYTWKLNSTIVANEDSIYVSKPGSYNIIVEDINGCIDSTLLDVSIDTIPPAFSLVIDNVISCEDSVSVVSSGPLDNDLIYNWSGPTTFLDRQNEIEVTGGGIFKLTAENSKGCITTDSIDVGDVRVIPDFNFTSSNIDCNGNGTIMLSNVINAAILKWNGPESIANDDYVANINVPGTYTATATSDLGCDFIRNIIIGIDTISPKVLNKILDTITCFDPIVEIGFRIELGFDSILWSGPIDISSKDSSIFVNEEGAYLAKIVGLNGCFINRFINVIKDTIKPNKSILGDTLTCLKSKLLLSLTNYDKVSKVSWKIGQTTSVSPTLFINKPGIYYIDIQGENGCIQHDSLEVIEDKDVPSIELLDSFYLPCDGSLLTLSLNSDVPVETYRWVGNSYFSDLSMPEVQDPGVIYVFVAGRNGCNSFDSTLIILDDRPIDFDLTFDTITCKQPFAVLNALRVDDDESFYWEFPDGSKAYTVQAIGLEGGAFKLVVNRGNNCLDSISFEVVYDTITPKASIVYTENFQCKNTIVDMQGYISASRNSSIGIWSTIDGKFVNGITPPVSEEGTYRFTAVDTINGCKNIAEQEIIREPQSLAGLEFNIADPLCLYDANGYIDVVGIVGGFGTLSYNINGLTLLNTSFFDSLRSGEYHITAIDSFGCEIDTTIVLYDGLFYEITIQGDTIVALGDSLLLTFEDNQGGLFYDSITWVNRDSTICADCDETYVSPNTNTIYTLTTVTENGCIAQDEILIRVDSDFVVDLPNIFSPNGDGVNDVFKISALKGFEEVLTFMIFDRWGNVMHQEYNVDIMNQVGWDGIYDGRYALPGVYVLLMEIRLKNGRVIQKSSDITLLR